MKAILLSPTMLYGKHCDVMLENGKVYRRIARYSKEYGLYVMIANRRYYLSDMEIKN